jgi:hypothetical protein
MIVLGQGPLDFEGGGSPGMGVLDHKSRKRVLKKLNGGL